MVGMEYSCTYSTSEHLIDVSGHLHALLDLPTGKAPLLPHCIRDRVVQKQS